MTKQSKIGIVSKYNENENSKFKKLNQFTCTRIGAWVINKTNDIADDTAPSFPMLNRFIVVSHIPVKNNNPNGNNSIIFSQ